MKYCTMIFNKMSSSNFIKLQMLNFIIKKSEPVYASEILNYINNFDIPWQPSHGTVYDTIKEMIKEGLIVLDSEVGRKKYYAITEKGRKYYGSRVLSFKEMLEKSSDFYIKIAKNLETDASNKIV